MGLNNKIIGIIDVLSYKSRKNILEKLKFNLTSKYELYKKSRKYKKDIVIESLSSNYDLVKLEMWYQLYKSNKITILEPSIILDYDEIIKLIKLLKSIKLKYDISIEIFSKDTDFLISIVDYIFIKKHDIIIKEDKKDIILLDEKLLIDNKIKIPDIVSLINYINKEKNIKLSFRDNINDLLKDIYRKR